MRTLLPRVPLLAAILVACQAKPPVPARSESPVAVVSDSASIDQLRGRIDSLIGDAACTSVAQCRLVGIGAKACGGPRGYRVYSVGRTDSVALAAVAEALKARETELNRKEGRLSDCSMTRQPGIRVENGRCVLAE